MDRPTRNWLIRFGATFALFMAACWAAPRLLGNVPDFLAATAGQMQEEVFDRYFKQPVADIVIVGSSLAYHLKDQFFERGDVRNAAIPGGTPNTGLAIIDAAPSALPRAIAIETNILDRELDEPLFEKFRNATRPQRPLPVMRTLAAWYEGARSNTLPYGKERIRSILAAPPAPDRSEAAVDMLWDDWNRPMNRVAMLKHAKQLKSLTDKLEARGVRIFFFEMPYPSRLNGSSYAATSREVLAEVIGPDDKRRLALEYPADQLRSVADGVHLDDRSSVIFAAALDKAIHDRLGRE
jgi:hypothetical protein